MNNNNILDSEEFKSLYKAYLNIDYFNEKYFSAEMKNSRESGVGDFFRQNLKHFIDTRKITTSYHEELTDEDFDTNEDLYIFLDRIMKYL